MAFLDIRQRSGYLFLGMMLGHILLISAQVNSRSGVPILEAVTFGAVAEAQRAISTGFSSVLRVWSGYVGLRNVQRENEELMKQLEAAQVALQQQRALADRTRSLERLLDLRDRSNVCGTADLSKRRRRRAPNGGGPPQRQDPGQSPPFSNVNYPSFADSKRK